MELNFIDVLHLMVQNIRIWSKQNIVHLNALHDRAERFPVDLHQVCMHCGLLRPITLQFALMHVNRIYAFWLCLNSTSLYKIGCFSLTSFLSTKNFLLKLPLDGLSLKLVFSCFITDLCFLFC